MRWRRMFYLTGLPGWLRFGFSPGWGTIPPGAPYVGWVPVPWTKDAEIQWLTAQADALEQWLQAIKARLEELTKEKQ